MRDEKYEEGELLATGKYEEGAGEANMLEDHKTRGKIICNYGNGEIIPVTNPQNRPITRFSQLLVIETGYQ
ncbi:hypothetical protein E2C01_029065 [Portunus trituberculatus]|uniref:Uncharacterized protein n=1 Tax=Portunus trituberculatus TaxID=210409 RepID=A0A5B7ER93_PORTR|nr:hypothetical protein [Portunus trituberculatus]